MKKFVRSFKKDAAIGDHVVTVGELAKCLDESWMRSLSPTYALVCGQFTLLPDKSDESITLALRMFVGNRKNTQAVC